MNKRILLVRKANKLTQKEFGEIMGVSRDVIASYESGRVVPTGTFIQLLCSKFSVNEKWLRDGTGEMNAAQKSDLDILFETLSRNDPSGYKQRLVAVMARLDPAQWDVLEQIARDLISTEPAKKESDLAARVVKLEQENRELAAQRDVLKEILEKEETVPASPAPVLSRSH